MNDSSPESSTENGAAEPTAASRPNSWLGICLALSALAAASALGTVLLVVFWQSRPVDLRGHSQRLADSLETLLAYNQVPAANIARSPVEDRRDPEAAWRYARFEVDVPPTLSLSGLERVVRENMAREHVAVFDDPETAVGRAVLRLYAAGREFARVDLRGQAERTDLTEACRRVANEIVSVLNAASLLSFGRSAPVRRENEEAIWEFAHLDASLPDSVSSQALIDRIAGAVSGRPVYVRAKPGVKPGERLLTVSYNGLECVELALAESAGTTEPAPSQDLALLTLGVAGVDPDDLVRMTLPEPEHLPLESEHLGGEAHEQALPPPQRPRSDTLRVAIIVDDGGYGGQVTEDLLALDPNLTLSILPHTPFSADTARRAAELGFEVMLHMPMENSAGKTAFPGEIGAGMPPETIRELTGKAIEDVPGAVGVNNHTGSKFTSDVEAMHLFFEAIQNRSLYFIDSRTTSGSVAYHTAQELNVPAAARDLFLDHESEPDYIRARIRQLIEICKKQGSAIAICHFRRNTVDALREMLPEIKRAGIEIVHVSELVQ